MPNFTYINNIPAASHNPSVDQPDMQTNTNSTDSIIEVDHFSFNDDLGGYHKRADLVNQNAPFNTPAGVGSVILSSGNEWIFTNALLAGAGVQMTVSAKPPVATQNGSTFLPGGIILNWGKDTIPTGTFTTPGSATINFTTAFGTSFTPVVTISQNPTGEKPENLITIFVNDNINFTAINLGTQRDIYWTAIGPSI